MSNESTPAPTGGVTDFLGAAIGAFKDIKVAQINAKTYKAPMQAIPSANQQPVTVHVTPSAPASTGSLPTWVPVAAGLVGLAAVGAVLMRRR